MTITEFLLARIAEDEAVARSATPGRWFRDSGWSISAPAPEGWDGPYVVVETPRARNDSEFVARHDPARVLAECTAKRAVVAEHGPQEVASLDRSTWGQAFIVCRVCVCALGARQVVAPCPTLKALAAVYADHPDYQPEWAGQGW